MKNMHRSITNIIGCFALGICLLGVGWLTAAEAVKGDAAAFNKLQREMRARQFEQAVTSADALLAAKDAKADEAAYLKAVALFQAKNYAGSIKATEALLAQYPMSDWRYKAIFLKAQALVEQKNFKEAAAIYEAEAKRILSPERKQELAGVIISFADRLTVKPAANDPGATPPDFNKAYNLYNKALTMEISRELRDAVIFKKARAIQMGGNHSQAIQDFQAYLTEFDASWTGPAGSGSARQTVQNPLPDGNNILAARRGLAESQIYTGNPDQGRMEIEDLLKMIGALPAEKAPAGFAAELRWLQVQSFFTQRPETVAMMTQNTSSQIGNTGGLPATDSVLYTLSNGDLDAAIKICREFIAANPVGTRSVRAAWMIAEGYANAGRSDEAIAAYREFIAGKGFELPAGDAATKIEDEIRAAPATFLANLRMRAAFRIGQIQVEQKKYADAIATWQGYIKDYPNGSQWSDCQTGIVNIEYQSAIDLLAEKQVEPAVAKLEAFLRDHPLDDGHARTILYIFGALHEAKAVELETGKPADPSIKAEYRLAIDGWARLVSKYPRSEEANTALFRSAVILEEKLGEFEKALTLYQKLANEYGYGQAYPRLTALTQKTLGLSTERVFRTHEKPVVHLKARNLEKVTVRLYRLDLQSYFRKMHGITGVENLDLSLIQPDKSWEVKVADYAKYKPLEQDIEIPFEGAAAGAFVVSIGDEEQESTVLVLRSDIEIVVKSSLREVLAFAQDMRTGKPAAGVDVQVSDGAAVVLTGKTGADGVFKGALEKSPGNARAFALRGNHAAAYNLDLSGLRLSAGLMPKGFIYTDRPAYLPGETVSLRGILREVRNAAYAVPENSEFKVSITDPQGRMLSEQTVKLSRFGTFNASLELPGSAQNGLYAIAARQERKGQSPLAFSGSFEVRQFKLEKIKLALEFPQRVYFRGETVEGAVKARFYWGEPVAKRSLRYSLPDGRSYNAETDAEGLFKFKFDTTALKPGSMMSFSASLDGENVSVAETLTLARLGFTISATPSQPLVVAGEPVDIAIATSGADGKPSSNALTATLFRIEAAKPSPLQTMVPWLSLPSVGSAQVTVEEKKMTTDAVTGKASVQFTLSKGGDYRIGITGADRFGQAITGGCSVQASGDEDAVKLRFFADSATLKVGQEAAVRLHSRIASGLALLTYEGETILRYQIVELKKDYNAIPVAVGHDLFPNFRLAAAVIDGRELRTASKEFNVERELKVAVKSLKAAWLPGEAGKVEITVTDQTGKPVEAELSLALVNEALYAVCPDRTTPILEFFQAAARRNAEFRTGASSAFRYEGCTREIAKELRDEDARVARGWLEKKKRERVNQVFSGGMLGYDKSISDNLQEDKPRLEEVAFEQVAEGAMLYSARSVGGRMRSIRSYGGGRSADVPLRREVRGEGRWLPSIITGADGKATVTVTMPETTTEWRLTARGCTPETLVGEATAKTLTRKDFFVELKTPAFLREGDDLRTVGRLHNLTDYAGPVKLTLNIRDAKDTTKLLATREKTVTVKALGGEEVVFDAVTAPGNILQLDFMLSAEAGTNTDSLVQTVPVKPWGLEYAAHAGGTTIADITAVVGLPGGRPYSTTWMTVSVGPDIRNSVLDMALRHYWFGLRDDLVRICPPVFDEHPANDLLAVASALAYANQGKANDDTRRRLAERARTLVAALIASQEGNGAWSEATCLGRIVTPRAFWALVTARNAGIAVNATAIEKAAANLQQQFQGCDSTDNDTKAVLLHALSTDKRAAFANCNRLYRDRNSLGNAALAYLAQAFLNLDRKEISAELSGILEGKAKVTPGRPVCWESGCAMPWMNDTDETTALILLALAQTRPESKLADSAAQYLLQSHGCYGFPTARARGPAVAALVAYYGKGLEQTTDMEIAIVVNGTQVGKVKADGAQGFKLFQIPAAAVKADKNLVEFKMQGRGRYTYAATLFGFSPDTKATDPNTHPGLDACNYFHEMLQYRGRPLNIGSDSPVNHIENGQRVNVSVVDHHTIHYGARHFVAEVPLPPGARLVDGSLSSSGYTPDITDSSIIAHYNRGDWYNPTVSFQLAGYVPGKFRVLPPVIREVGNPGFMTVGPTVDMTVLAVGEKSPDPYVMNRNERYAFGKCYFDDGDYGAAIEYLAPFFEEDRNNVDLARMLLWCYTTPKFYDSRKIVNLFEILREKNPDLEIPFDRLLTVGAAYRDIGEFERSWSIYRAVVSASFANDSGISAVLEDEGRFLGSIAFQERVCREYPDTAEVVSASFAVSQLLYQKSAKAHELPKEDGAQPEKIDMLKRAADLLVQFLAHHPVDPLCDQAGFSLANAMLDLKNYPLVVRFSQEFGRRHANSKLAPSFQYMTALGLFWQSQYREAITAATVVANGDSKDRDFARYILGQVYHAESKPAAAIEWYDKVKTLYPDAAEAINYFEEKRIALDEVTIAKPGDKIVLPLKYRNIKEAFVQVYRVDLMKLCLQQKNLSQITAVQLAGIKPEFEKTLTLGDGKDYVDKERKLELGLRDEAAYLVICRGDDLFTSGMVLITPLKIEVQEDAVSGRVRANVLDTVKGGYRPEVHVKAIGSADSEFRGGETDLRGLFTADNLRGKATIIAREGTSLYAFYRGEKWLGQPANAPAQPAPQGQAMPSVDYQDNLFKANEGQQMQINSSFDQERRQNSKGVQMKKF